MKRQTILLDPAPGDAGGGGGVSVEDHHKGIEKARLEERAKLHDDTKKANDSRVAAEAAAEAAKVEAARLKAELEAVRLATTPEGGKVDVSKLVAEITTAAEERFKAAAASEAARLNSEIGALRGNLTTMQLEKLKDALIQEQGGSDKLVTALIDASSEASLRKSIAAAKAAYDEVETRVKAVATGTQQTGQANPVVVSASPPVNPQGGGGAGGGVAGTILATVKQMSTPDYKANRTKVLADLKTLYPASRG